MASTLETALVIVENTPKEFIERYFYLYIAIVIEKNPTIIINHTDTGNKDWGWGWGSCCINEKNVF